MVIATIITLLSLLLLLILLCNLLAQQSNVVCKHLMIIINVYLFDFGATALPWARVSSFTMFLDPTRHTTVCRTPLDKWSARRRDLYLITHTAHSRQTSRPPERFEPTISEVEWPQTHALDRAATGTGNNSYYNNNNSNDNRWTYALSLPLSVSIPTP